MAVYFMSYNIVKPNIILQCVVTASKASNLYILFAITATGVLPCGGRKKSPRTSSIVQIISFLSVF